MRLAIKSLCATLVGVGILASAGFQDPGGPGGIEVTTGYWAPNLEDDVPFNEGECYSRTGNPLAPLQWHQKVGAPGKKCDNGVYCAPIASCSPFPEHPDYGPFCLQKKSTKFVMVGTCVPKANKTCPTCPGESQILCMVYKLYQGGTAGTCNTWCGKYQLVFGGDCKITP